MQSQPETEIKGKPLTFSGYNCLEDTFQKAILECHEVWKQLDGEAPLKVSDLRTHCAGNLRRIETAYATAGQKFPKTLIGMELDPREGISIRDLVRLDLVCQSYDFLDGSEAAFVDFLWNLYDKGDLNEQISLVKALPYFKEIKGLEELAAHVVRTNIPEVLAALAISNAFPAAYMDEQSFNQMVVKCLFTDLDVTRIIGLSKRINKKLIDMVLSYKSELISARRPVKDGINAILKMSH